LCIASMFGFAAQIAVRAINRKILSGFHRSNCFWDFNETTEDWSVPSRDLHVARMFRFNAQNGRQSFERSNHWQGFDQNSQVWSVPITIYLVLGEICFCDKNTL
jgi:hypothetical protein